MMVSKLNLKGRRHSVSAKAMLWKALITLAHIYQEGRKEPAGKKKQGNRERELFMQS